MAADLTPVRRFVLSANGQTLDGPASAVHALPAAGATLVDLWSSDVVPLDNATAGDPTMQGGHAAVARWPNRNQPMSLVTVGVAAVAT